MTPERALARVMKLLALAAPNSGASEEERWTAALTAAAMMHEHGFVPSNPTTSAIDLDEVVALALHAAELEHLLASERASCAARLRERDEEWRRRIEEVRREEQTETRRAAKLAARRAAAEEREAQARAGGRARAQQLDDARKQEIASTAAQARWKTWRERHDVESK
jgi:hypothetical protein